MGLARPQAPIGPPYGSYRLFKLNARGWVDSVGCCSDCCLSWDEDVDPRALKEADRYFVSGRRDGDPSSRRKLCEQALPRVEIDGWVTNAGDSERCLKIAEPVDGALRTLGDCTSVITGDWWGRAPRLRGLRPEGRYFGLYLC